MDPTKHDSRSSPNDLPPRAAWLMAYLDGEMAAEERTRVEAWISQDSEGHHQHEEERRRRQLFATCPVPEPDAQAWDDTLARIEAGLAKPPADSQRPAPRRGSRLWVVVGVAAAAVLAAIWLRNAGLFIPAPKPHDDSRPLAELLEVANAADVTIDDMDPADALQLVMGRVPDHVPGELRAMSAFVVSTADEITVETMDGEDTDLLVVGLPPVEGPLVMATPGEVKVHDIQRRDKRHPMPYLLEPSNPGGMPMINVPLKTVRKD